MLRIAVDAMGGDFAPLEIVAGAVQAAKHLAAVERIFLIGDQSAIERELLRHGPVSPKIEIRHASETVDMDESPASAIRRKRDNSISRAVDMVKAGEADAVLSAGNTGAMVVAATLKLRTLQGVSRPAIATVMPTQDRPVLLLDAGANAMCDAAMLLQFAIMGSVYSREVLGQPRPVVGLLSIGGEESKGNDTTLGAFPLLKSADEQGLISFRGNVEGHDIFRGETDVVVCDGFTGNVVLKTSESASRAITYWMKREFTANPLRMFGARLLRGALRSMKRRMDPDLHGGAPLLGVNGVCIITHGSSHAKGIFHAIRVASEAVGHQINDRMVNAIGKASNIA
ncbi:MAG: phosphate acyltransferase PlsX [bacterium]